jgi:hypothetical protein
MKSINKCNTCKIYLINNETPDIMICNACQIKFYLKQIFYEIPVIRKINDIIDERR